MVAELIRKPIALVSRSQSEQRAALEALDDLTDLWAVADRLAARLRAIRIETPLQLRDADPRHVRKYCSVVLERIVYRLRAVTLTGKNAVFRPSAASSNSSSEPLSKAATIGVRRPSIESMARP